MGPDRARDRRPGTRVPLVLTLPWSDPRSYGDSLQPHWMHIDAEEADVVIDDGHGVTLEWNGLVDDKVIDHKTFTAIDFDIDPDVLGPRHAEVDSISANR